MRSTTHCDFRGTGKTSVVKIGAGGAAVAAELEQQLPGRNVGTEAFECRRLHEDPHIGALNASRLSTTAFTA